MNPTHLEESGRISAALVLSSFFSARSITVRSLSCAHTRKHSYESVVLCVAYFLAGQESAETRERVFKMADSLWLGILPVSHVAIMMLTDVSLCRKQVSSCYLVRCGRLCFGDIFQEVVLRVPWNIIQNS